MTRFYQIMETLDELYPPALAETWDKVGMHFGHPQASVKKLMVALDVRPAVVQEAVTQGVDSLIVHHPPIFTPIDYFDASNPQLAMYGEIIKEDLNVFAMHTNLDRAHNGMNDWLAEELNLEEIEPLSGYDSEGQPSLGRIGKLKNPLSRTQLISYLKEVYQRDPLIVIERQPRPSYEKVAIVGGSGAEFYRAAQSQGADVFITGDITYHKAHDAYEADLMTVDMGHYIEHIFVNKMSHILQELNQDKAWGIDIIASQVSTNPYHYE